MSTEPTVIRRYTPPTCSLEIAAQQSPLSRWMGKVALKDLRFKLSFDDPRVDEDNWLILRGDRTQLEALNEAVNEYVQSFLNQSPTLPGNTATLLAAPITAPTAPNPAGTTGISLVPKGLLSHQLNLGALATETSGASVPLSSTQLADLASALDEYASEAVALPNLTRQSTGLAGLSKPNWAALAAGVLVAVGLGTSLLNRSAPTPTTGQASSSDQRMALNQPPSPSPTPLPPGLSPLSTLPSPGQSPSPIGNTTIAGLPSPIANSAATNTPTPNPSAPTIGNSSGSTGTGNGSVSITTPPEPAIATDKIGGAGKTPFKNTPETDRALSDNPNATTPEMAEGLKQRAAAQAQLEAAESAPTQAARVPSPVTTTPPAGIMAPSAASRRVFDTPQSDEVRRYFQRSWTKQAGVDTTVEYAVELAGDGSVSQLQPRGTEAERLVSRPGMPAAGDKIASPSQDGNPSTIVVMLKPDGSVEAFPQ
jgi:hypothetical protein